MTDLPLGPAASAWFRSAFVGPTPVQSQGWAAIAAGHHALLVAPTGSGKTLAAFLFALDRLTAMPEDAPAGVRVLYISPLKALAYDVERNLRAPLVGITQAAARLGLPLRTPRVSMRTGDTPSRDRAAFKRAPGEILVTTPESLFLLLTSESREALRSVDTVIVDEVHALAPTKRGAHLSLSLERLERLCVRPPQRIGLSATVRPQELVARWLGGDRPVCVVDASAPPNLDLTVDVPVRDLTRPEATARGVLPPLPEREGAHDYGQNGMGYGAFQGSSPARGIWAVLPEALLALVRAHRSTIVFVNSRSLCERLARNLNELDGGSDPPLVRAHHGSVSHGQRAEIEEALKAGTLRGIVATSSLELGIDMGAVDLVVLVASPGSTARGLQRAGRAGHQVGASSRAVIFPKFPADLLECAVLAGRMLAADIEPIATPINPLDVLAQQIVAMVSVQDLTIEDLAAVLRRSHPFRALSDDALAATLDMLAGRYPSTDFADLRPRLLWDRATDLLQARKGARLLAVQNAGTIPDRGLFAVHQGEGGPRVGELDEEMVHESRPGETFVLGASTWRIQSITRDRVLVTPAPGEPGRMPFWHGDGPGRPIELGRAIGAFLRELDAVAPDAAVPWLDARLPFRGHAARNLVDYVAQQKEATGVLPTDRTLVIERFRDELGDWRICILSPFGGRVHAPWALALEAALSRSAGFAVRALHGDDGIVLRLADSGEDALPASILDLLVPDPEEVADLVLEQLAESALFAALFRENAGRALLLPRQRRGSRTPLWAQRLRAQGLLAVARQFPAFPIVLETYREALNDHFDLPALQTLLADIRARRVRIHVVDTPSASPFARSLVHRYVAEYLYDGDAPSAERRAQALLLDRELLRDLLGQEELRNLLDAGEIAALEAELQGLTEERAARHADGLHDLLRRVGALRADEIAARCGPDQDGADWLRSLMQARRVLPLRIAGEERYAVVEDAALFRDGLGVALPPGLPAAFLASADRPLRQLLLRYARCHGPFLLDEAGGRFGVGAGTLAAAAQELIAEGALLVGAFRPGGRTEEHCAPEVLRSLRRRTLARLRGEVAPVEAPALARFLGSWQGVAPLGVPPSAGPERLLAVLTQLEGLPLSLHELETRILPARVRGFTGRQLDDLSAEGAIAWVGAGALSADDGRVQIVRRGRLPLLVPPPASPPDDPIARAVLAALEESGASFLSDLAGQLPADLAPRDLREALWDLAWGGFVTNDTFAALRALRGRARPDRGRRAGGAGVSGRWSAVSRLHRQVPNDTERLHASAVTLLERWGIVSREVATAEAVPGGFSAIYPVLAALEQRGATRRGWFCEGLTGAQFASPGAVDRLRSSDAGEPGAVVLLAATDPANPYGAALPWPAIPGPAALTPRRVPGSSVVLVGGWLALFASRGAERLTTFPAPEGAVEGAFAALPEIARGSKARSITVQQIDGAPARPGPWEAALRTLGFAPDRLGWTLELA